MDITEILKEAIKTTQARHATYKDGYNVQARVMKALYPDGIHLTTEEEMAHFFFVFMMMVKLTRYVVSDQSGARHEDSAHDLGMYALMVQQYNRERPPASEHLEKPDFEGTGRAEAKPDMCYAVYALNPNGSRQSGFCPKCGYLCASHVANAVEVLARQEVRTTVK